MKKGCVLVSKLNPRKSRVMLVDETDELVSCASTEFMSYVPKNSDADLHFYKFYFDGPVFNRRLQVCATGSTNSHVRVSPSETLLWKIFQPPLPEQQKIASILTSVDDVIEKTQSQINKLQDLKKGTMNELLTRGIGPGGVPHTEFVDSPVGKIPRGWGVVKMTNVSDVIDSLHQTPSFASTGYPMVRVTDIKSGNINLSKTQKVTESVFLEFTRKYAPAKGDIVISRVGSYGVTSFVETSEKFCIGQNTAIINPKNIDSKYLYYFLNSFGIKNHIEYEVAGSGYKSLSLQSIRDLPVNVPSTDEQSKIASILSSIDKNIEEKQSKLEQTKFLKKSLMQDLLTGKVRVYS